MSEPFVNGPFPMRWEFDTLLNDLTAAAFEVPTNGVAYAEARADVLRAYDATLARIAELEEKNAIQALHIEAIGKELIEANAACDAWEAAAKEGS